jgi:PAS domain S-box-containing protein
LHQNQVHPFLCCGAQILARPLLTDAFNQMLAQIQEQDHNVRDSEARVRAIVNSALSAVVVIGTDGNIIDWNPRAEQMFGWKREELIGREMATAVLPESHRQEHRRGLQHFLATGEGPVLNQLIEISALRRDGTEFPVELSISPIVADGVTTFCGFITDITERKQAQSRVQTQLSRLDLLHQITRAIGERGGSAC